MTLFLEDIAKYKMPQKFKKYNVLKHNGSYRLSKFYWNNGIVDVIFMQYVSCLNRVLINFQCTTFIFLQNFFFCCFWELISMYIVFATRIGQGYSSLQVDTVCIGWLTFKLTMRYPLILIMNYSEMKVGKVNSIISAGCRVKWKHVSVKWLFLDTFVILLASFLGHL